MFSFAMIIPTEFCPLSDDALKHLTHSKRNRRNLCYNAIYNGVILLKLLLSRWARYMFKKLCEYYPLNFSSVYMNLHKILSCLHEIEKMEVNLFNFFLCIN